MPSQGRSQRPERSRKKQATQEGVQEHAVRIQAWKEGSPETWQAMLRDAARDGELVRTPESEEQAPLDDLDEDAVDCEMDLGDEDDLSSEQSEAFDKLEGADFAVGESDDVRPEESASLGFRIVVRDGHCRLEVPHWLAGTPSREDGEHPLEDPFQRLEFFQHLAGWLNDNRSAFLLDPDPWNLGVNALAELKGGNPSVTEKGLLALLEGRGKDITRWKRHAILVWADGSLPLKFLFSIQAKVAWAANVLLQKYPTLNENALNRVTDLTTPKLGKAKNPIKTNSLDSLEFDKFILRVCLEAGVAWKHVLPVLHSRIANK
jgi:hypothetical protein